MTEARKYIRIKIDRRVFIACGVAGAISAGFNAHRRVLFAHEALLRRISIGAIAPIAVASIVAYAANQAFFDIEPTFSVPDMPIELQPLIPFLIVTAVLSAGSAVAYMVAIRKGRSSQRGLNGPFEPISSCVVVVGCIGVVLPDVTGLSLTQVNQMIDAQFTLGMLITLLAAKIFVTAYCLNTGFFGGVFGQPFVGAATGAIAAYLALTADFPHTRAMLCPKQPLSRLLAVRSSARHWRSS